MKHENSTQASIDVDSTRQRILEAAAQEFADFGLAGARVDRIAHTAGINKAMIYYHFQSKEGLYRTVITERQREIIISLSQQISESQTVEEILRVAAQAHSRALAESPQSRAIMLRELANPSEEVLGAMAKTVLESGIPAQFLGRLQAGMADGRFRELDLRQTIIAFLSMSMGYHLLAPLIRKVLPAEDQAAFDQQRIDYIVDIFLNGLHVRS